MRPDHLTDDQSKPRMSRQSRSHSALPPPMHACSFCQVAKSKTRPSPSTWSRNALTQVSACSESVKMASSHRGCSLGERQACFSAPTISRRPYCGRWSSDGVECRIGSSTQDTKPLGGRPFSVSAFTPLNGSRSCVHPVAGVSSSVSKTRLTSRLSPPVSLTTDAVIPGFGTVTM